MLLLWGGLLPATNQIHFSFQKKDDDHDDKHPHIRDEETQFVRFHLAWFTAEPTQLQLQILICTHNHNCYIWLLGFAVKVVLGQCLQLLFGMHAGVHPHIINKQTRQTSSRSIIIIIRAFLIGHRKL